MSGTYEAAEVRAHHEAIEAGTEWYAPGVCGLCTQLRAELTEADLERPERTAHAIVQAKLAAGEYDVKMREKRVTKTKPCKEPGCPYLKEPGKHRCVWHRLLAGNPDDRVDYARATREAWDLRGLEVRTRVPKDEWPEGERWCSGCQDFVPLFYCSGSRCKGHDAEASHGGRLESVYGITRAEYEAMLELQGGVCAACGQKPRTKRLAVDHDHETGRVRGLLCADQERGCNHAVLGSIEARSVDGPIPALRRMIAYLENPPYDQISTPTPQEAHHERPRPEQPDVARRPGPQLQPAPVGDWSDF